MESEATDGGALQIKHRVTQHGSGATDLAVAALSHRQLQQGAIRLLRHHLQPHWLAGPSLQRHTGPPASQGFRLEMAPHPHPISARMAVAGMGEAQREGTVVGQQQRAPAVGIQPTHRVQAAALTQTGGKQIEHGGTALRVVTGADHPHRFVQQDQQRRRPGREGAAIDRDPIDPDIGPVPQPGGGAVHAHSALAQQVFGPAAGAEAGSRDQLLQLLPPGRGELSGRRNHGPERGGSNSTSSFPPGGTAAGPIGARADRFRERVVSYETRRFLNSSFPPYRPLRTMPSVTLAGSAALGLSADLVRSYLRDIGRVPLLSHEQEITLGRQVQELMALEEMEEELRLRLGEAPSQEALAQAVGLSVPLLKRRLQAGRRAKERMVAANLRLVVSVAKKYTKRNMELLDLIQEGTIGLVRGVEKFDPTRGYKFSTYAYWWIRQGITRAIAEKSRSIRLPIHITETLNKLKKGQRELSQELGRTPTITELAAAVELPEEEVKDLLFRARQPVSLETKVGDGEDTELLDLLAGEGAGPDEVVAGECLRGDLRALLEQLPELQGRVLRLRYGMEGEEPMSLTGIARTLGLSRDKTRNLERRALEQIRSRSQELHAYLAA